MSQHLASCSSSFSAVNTAQIQELPLKQLNALAKSLRDFQGRANLACTNS
jgi:hypothetical protein